MQNTHICILRGVISDVSVTVKETNLGIFVTLYRKPLMAYKILGIVFFVYFPILPTCCQYAHLSYFTLSISLLPTDRRWAVFVL